MGDRPAAASVITEALDTITEQAPRLRLLGRRAINNAYAGELASALADSEQLAASPDDDTAARGASVLSVALAASGRGAEGVRVARAGYEAASRTNQAPFGQLVGTVFGHADMGMLDDAEAVALEGYEDCARSSNTEGAATYALLTGSVLVEKGDCAGAVRLFREGAAASRDLRDIPNLRWCLGGMALAEGIAGNGDAAGEALKELDEFPPQSMVLFDPDLIHRGRAWSKVAAGEISAGCAILRAAADDAAAAGCWTAEAKLRHDLVRLGEARLEAARLLELASVVDGPLVAGFARHADAICQREATGLEETAEAFATMHANLLAAEAFVEAATAYQRDGLKRRAATAGRRAEEFRGLAGMGRTPTLTDHGTATLLTKCEREVATLAASGRLSREIAELLFLSVRTVDNQLQRVYTKLGITSRDALSGALGAED